MWFQGNIQTILNIVLCRAHNSICDVHLSISAKFSWTHQILCQKFCYLYNI